MSEESTRDTSKLPPAPALPAELLHYPAQPPDWVDEVAARAARRALQGLADRIAPMLASIESSIADAQRVNAANWEAARNESLRHAERLRALEERVAKLEAAAARDTERPPDTERP